MVPDLPTATNLLSPYVTALISLEVPGDLEVHEIPSDEEIMVPFLPTDTKVLPP